MGLETAPDAGSFEPIRMEFIQVKYPVNSFGEALATPVNHTYCKRPFRYQKVYGRESNDLGQTKAPQTVIIEVRRDRFTEGITTNMFAKFKGQLMGITDIQPKASNAAYVVMTIQHLQPTSVGTDEG